MSDDKTIELFLKTYRIPIMIISEDELVEKTMELTDNMLVSSTCIKIDPSKENVGLRITEYSKKVGRYNSNQKKITLDLRRDYINKQIITKK